MKKPFIKLFNTDRKFYFYDVNTNKIVNVSKESYEILEHILRKNNFEIDDLNIECKRFMQAGLLQSNCIREIKNNCEDILGALDSQLQSLLLQVTRDCNLRCKYCFYSGKYEGIRQHQKQQMSWETCKACIDYFMLRSSSDDVVNVGFYGGEPLLNFTLIKKSVEYIKSVYPQRRIQYSITTNAVLLTPIVFNFFKNHDFLITVSVDGPQYVHDANRIFIDGTGSYSILRKNIEYIYTYHFQYLKENLRYNAVLTQEYEAVKTFFSNDEIFGEMSGKLSQLNTFHSNNFIFDNKVQRRNSSSSKIRTLINSLKKPDSDLRIKSILDKLEASFDAPMITTIAAGMCVPGVSRLFATVTGDFYMCEKTDDDSDEYRIGNVFEGWNEENINKLANMSNISPENGCKGCWAIRLCNMCAAKICAMNQLQLDKKCEEVRKSIEVDLKHISLIQNNKLE